MFAMLLVVVNAFAGLYFGWAESVALLIPVSLVDMETLLRFSLPGYNAGRLRKNI